MIDPRTQYIVYQQQMNERMQQIEWMRTARENGGYVETEKHWYVEAEKWLKEKVFARVASLNLG